LRFGFQKQEVVRLMQTNNDAYFLLKRVLAVSVQYLGIQSSATDVLSILYLARLEDQTALPIKEIVRRTGLSLSSVSVLCSRLEAEGILHKHTDDSGASRGRRRILYEFIMSIDDLLVYVMRKYLQDIGRVHREIKLHQIQDMKDDDIFKELLTKLENAVRSFLTNKGRLVSGNESLWYGPPSKDDLDLKEKLSESTL
jgi:DNA-binding transcriptional regulator GbsR (MarR family)